MRRAVIGYAVLLCALWYPVFTSHQVCAWDCVLEYWPDLVFQVHSVQHHTLPLWCPWSLGGYPFAGDLQSGLYSPVNWICIAFGLVFGTGAWLIQLKVMLGMLVGLCGVHALAWSRTRSHLAGFVAAITYVLGSPLLVHKNGAFLWPLLYLPWAVLALSRFFDAPSLRRGALLGLAIWLCGSAGHPQAFFYDLVVLAAYGTFRAVSVRQWRAALAGLAVAFVIAALTLAVVYLPSIDAIALSDRAVRSASYVLDGGVPPSELRELFVPNLDGNWQIDVYVGPLAIVGAIWALLGARSRNDRRETIFWCALAAIGMVLALGRDGHLLAFCYRYVPGFTLFRIAYRLKVIFGFAAAVLAGDGIAAIARVRMEPARRYAWAAAACWLVVAAIIARTPYLISQNLIFVAALVPLGARLGGRPRSIAIALLVLVDLWAAGASKLAILQPRPDPDAHADIVASMPGAADHWRYHVDDVVLPTGGTVPYETAYHDELRDFSGYGNPIASRRQTTVEREALRTPGLLAHFGVRYLLGGHVHPPDARRSPMLRGFELDDVAPLAVVYPAAERLREGAVLDRLRGEKPSQLTRALVEADAPPGLPVSSFAPVAADITRYTQNELELDVSAPQAGVLVVNEPWFPGWVAYVDGIETAPFRANYLSRAVVVPSGTSHVRFVFEPAHYRLLMLAFVLGLGLGLGLAALGLRSGDGLH
ncbi:MAG TPA: hypothetical protein VGG74_32525 [Kofleriaceae bacterium]|jgi:hypothetical protein